MGRNGLPYFPLDVDDYLEDEAVVLMSAEAEGCYIRLLCRSWKSKTPGRIPLALIPELCGLHRVPDSHRDRVLKEIERAFTVTPDGWTQRRMTVEYRRAESLYESRKRGAGKTNAGNNVTRSPRAERTLSGPVSARSPGVGVGVGVDSDSERLLTLNPILPARPATPPARKPESTPVAQRPVNRTDTKPNPDALERATCHRCRNKFARPVGSQRTLCPPCHDSG